MNALVALAGPTSAQQPTVRLFPLKGDGWEPALKRGDMLLVADAHAYEGEGGYLLDQGDGEEGAYMAERRITTPEVFIWHPNPKYSRQLVSLDYFVRAVRAKVVAEVKVRDIDILRRVR